MKYSISVSLRLGALISIWIGQDEYVFELRKKSFRDTEFEQIVMCKRDRFAMFARFTDEELPFTTAYGRNWVPWMVVRELESNTLDEAGVSFRVDDVDSVHGAEGRTRIAIIHPEIEAAWDSKTDIFLPNAVREGHGIQVLPAPSKFIYWRGLKVFELNKPALHSYNFLDPLELTEDRTLRAEYFARQALADWLVDCDDEPLIEEIITIKDEGWEKDLQPSNWIRPSRAFHNVMMRHPKNVHPAFYGYYSRHDERPRKMEFNIVEVHPAPWKLDGNAVFDSRGVKVFDEPYGYEGRWEDVGRALIQRASMGAPESSEAADLLTSADLRVFDEVEPSTVEPLTGVEADDDPL